MEQLRKFVAAFLIFYAILVLFGMINPEAWFFGRKIAGFDVIILLALESLIAVLLAYLLLKRFQYSDYLVVIFYIFNWFAVPFSPLYSIGLLLSMLNLFKSIKTKINK